LITSEKLDRWIFHLLSLYCLLFAVSVPGAYLGMDLAILLLLVRLLHSRQGFKLDRKWLVLGGAFMLAMLVASLQGVNMNKSLFTTWRVGYTMLFPFLLGVHAVGNTTQRKRLLGFIAVSMTIACIYEIYLGMLGRGLDGGFLGRLQLAGQIILVLPLYVLGITAGHWRQSFVKPLLSVLTAVTFVALVYSGIRGAWIAFGALGVCLFGMIPARRSRKLAVTLVLAAVLGVIVASQPVLTDKFITGMTMKSQSISERFLMWRSAWNMFADHPVLGVGPAGFGTLYVPHYFLPEASQREHTHPHNIFVQTLAESGIVGIVTFGTLWTYSLYRLISTARHPVADFWQQAAPVALCGWLVLGLTDNIMYWFPASFQFLWFLAGAAWNTEHNLKEASS